MGETGQAICSRTDSRATRGEAGVHGKVKVRPKKQMSESENV